MGDDDCNNSKVGRLATTHFHSKSCGRYLEIAVVVKKAKIFF